MRRRKAPLPKIWLMTDERGGDPVAIARTLPRRSGIVFRHHTTPAAERRALFDRVRQIARKRQLMLLLAATPARARAWGADGAHHRSALTSKGYRSVAVHSRCELIVAARIKADLVFVSPVFATSSHPGTAGLGLVRLGLMVGAQSRQAVALGGMNACRFKKLRGLKIHGWAAIDALKPDQNLNAVPT
jgi:thiamine-phosphate pyrophosphorylase